MVTQTDTLYVKKLTMNKAEIMFDDINKALKWDNILDNLHVQRSKIIWNVNGITYFGFKMFRCRYQMMQLTVEAAKLGDE